MASSRVLPQAEVADLDERPANTEVVVYTAVAGGYDDLQAPAIKVPGWRLFRGRAIHRATRLGDPGLPRGDLDPIRRARHVKILAHRFLPEFDVSIWIDANIGIAGDLAEFRRMALTDADIACFAMVRGAHPSLRKSRPVPIGTRRPMTSWHVNMKAIAARAFLTTPVPFPRAELLSAGTLVRTSSRYRGLVA